MPAVDAKMAAFLQMGAIERTGNLQSTYEPGDWLGYNHEMNSTRSFNGTLSKSKPLRYRPFNKHEPVAN